ncbi:AraC family transcriptional regulator [Actinomadura hibisca]|uniref:AraC family transcriptional regulator n=1 Tax=Actinomadura hibisca TaxID=68565 RepID=UPI0008298C44|nr:AraC family transcriptional regulator [Actinomadura hibisca]
MPPRPVPGPAGPDPTVPIHFAHRLLLIGQRRGIDVRPVLRDAGIPADVAANPRARITAQQMVRVTRELWRLTDDELFGSGPPVPRGTFQMLGLTLVHAPDLRSALERLVNGSRVVAGVPRVTVEYGRSLTVLEIDTGGLDDPERLVTEWTVALGHRLLGWLVGSRIVLRSLELPYPAPPHAADYVSIYGRPPVFAAPRTAFAFDSGLLDAPVVRGEADLTDYIGRAPADFYAVRDYGSTTADRVRSILEHGLGGAWPTAAEIAARLAVSPQHLRRLLHDEGTSVTRIREEILRDAAVTSLVRGEEGIDELAARLGFSEASAFRRAFRRWTGSPPGAYRGTG